MYINPEASLWAGIASWPGKVERLAKFKRYQGTITLDPPRVGRDASQIAEEVIAHLAGLPDAEANVILEITFVNSGSPQPYNDLIGTS